MFPSFSISSFVRTLQPLRHLSYFRSAIMGGGSAPTSSTKTVVVLGMSYGGARAAQVLAEGLPDDWRVIGIDRNSHLNHKYVMPRFAVLPGHEHKAFIPYTNVFLEGVAKPNHVVLKADVTSLRPGSVTISESFSELGVPSTEIAFDYAVYALGATMPAPLDLWGKDPRELGEAAHHNSVDWVYRGTKADGIKWLKERQKITDSPSRVLVVGGGALGIQFATDIKAVHPSKRVTLLHSRAQLLPRFDPRMHEEICKTMQEQGIELILGERLDLSSLSAHDDAADSTVNTKVVSTESGRRIPHDLLLMCTGQTPNTSLLTSMDASTINPLSDLAYVKRTMQVTTSPVFKTPTSDQLSGNRTYENIFAIGDSADAFGATKSGRSAWFQGDVAGKNIVKLVTKPGEPLDEYVPEAPKIKVTLGLTKMVTQSAGKVSVTDKGVDDLEAGSMWPLYYGTPEKDEEMLA